jgi:hypothetical protein
MPTALQAFYVGQTKSLVSGSTTAHPDKIAAIFSPRKLIACEVEALAETGDSANQPASLTAICLACAPRAGTASCSAPGNTRRGRRSSLKKHRSAYQIGKFKRSDVSFDAVFGLEVQTHRWHFAPPTDE